MHLGLRDQYGDRINVQSDASSAKNSRFDEQGPAPTEGIENQSPFLCITLKKGSNYRWMKLGWVAKEIMSQPPDLAVDG